MSIPLFAYITESTCGPGSNEWSHWHWLALAYAAYCAYLGFSYRRKLMLKAVAALAANPLDKKALKTWDASQFVPLTFAENIAVVGAFIRFVLDGALWQAFLFYTFAHVLLLLWSPQRAPKPALSR